MDPVKENHNYTITGLLQSIVCNNTTVGSDSIQEQHPESSRLQQGEVSLHHLILIPNPHTV